MKIDCPFAIAKDTVGLHIVNKRLNQFKSFVNMFHFILFFNILECVRGVFGDACKNQCGNCANNTKCHHVTGTCLHGCEPGYLEDDCSLSK